MRGEREARDADIRQIDARIPVVFITAYATTETAQQADVDVICCSTEGKTLLVLGASSALLDAAGGSTRLTMTASTVSPCSEK